MLRVITEGRSPVQEWSARSARRRSTRSAGAPAVQTHAVQSNGFGREKEMDRVYINTVLSSPILGIEFNRI